MTDTLGLPKILAMPEKIKPILTGLNDYELFLVEGGRGSGKSQSVARFILYLGEQRKLRIVCGREIQANIEESVYALLKDLISDYGLAYEVMARKIKHRWTGTEITFKGFREQGSVSVKGLEGVDLLWIDEAQSITKPTLDVIMPTIRKENSKVFFTMNRFLREDAVPHYCAGRPECLHVTVNYFDNPFCPLSLKNQAQTMKERSMRDYEHVWLGKPLAQADDYLFNFDKLHNAFDIKPFGEFPYRQRVMGIDFAAQGNDLCVATVLDRTSNQHWSLSERIAWDQPDTTVSIGKIVNMIGDFKPDVTILDIGGMGKPVFDRLLEIGMNITAFDGGTTQGIHTKHYINKRAAAYYLLKDWFDSEFLCIDRKDKEVIGELERIKMKYRSNGARVIQSKQDMKKELKYSPDNADSLNMAVWGAVHHLSDGVSNSSNSLSKTGGNVIRRTSSSRRGARRR